MSESSLQRLRQTLFVERRLPYRVKHQLGWLGVLPTFLIVGAQKAGTTSLYAYLRQHPCVHVPDMRELHYFTHKLHSGLNWYKARFPSAPVKYFDEWVRHQPFATGESSPSYLLYPQVPKRVAALIPNVKLIVLVRNPVDRAYSHHSMMVRRKFETLSFAEAIAQEEERTQAEWERASRDEHYVDELLSTSLSCHTYLRRGVYLDRINAWLKHFPREQMLILHSEAFWDNPQAMFSQTLEFLGLPPFDLPTFKNLNQGTQSDLDPGLRRELQAYFKPHNQRLYDFLGTDLGWEESVG